MHHTEIVEYIKMGEKLWCSSKYYNAGNTLSSTEHIIACGNFGLPHAISNACRII